MLAATPGVFVVLLACVWGALTPPRGRYPARPKSCDAPYLPYGSITRRQRGRTVEYMCDATYQLVGNRYAVCVGGKWDVPVPLCAKGGCIKPQSVTNGNIMLGEGFVNAILFCLPGYEVAGAREAFCDGHKWDRQLGSCRETRVGPQTICDFESSSLCGWTNDDSHDVNWIRSSGVQSSPERPPKSGAKHDHTIGRPLEGHFMTINSLRHVRNARARFLSPIYNSTDSRGCFQFYYHMYGANVGTLAVYQKPLSTFKAHTLYNLTGNQGNIWHRGDVILKVISEPFQLIFEATMSSSSTDMAIDDVQLSTCDSPDTTDTTVPTTEEEGGVFSVDSCRDRCSENASVATNGSFVKEQAEEGISLRCDCHNECLDINSCCPDYMEVCLSSSTPSTQPDTTIETLNALSWAVLAACVAATGTLFLLGFLYWQRRRKIREAPGCGDVVFERKRGDQDAEDSDIKCLTSADDEELDFTPMTV